MIPLACMLSVLKGGRGGGGVKYRENHQKLNKKIKGYGAKSFTERVGFYMSVEYHHGVCFPDCLW